MSIFQKIRDSISPLEEKKINDKLDLSIRIAELIKKKKHSQKSFAEKCGKQPSEISKWLNGGHNFQMETLSEIAFHLGIDISEFFKIVSY